MASKGRYAAAAAIVVLGLGGCSSSGGSGDDVAGGYCDALADLADVVAQKDTFTDATPINEVRDWSRDVAAAFGDVVDARGDLADANAEQLADAASDVAATVNESLSDAETLGDVRAALTSGAETLQSAVSQAQRSSNCEADPAASPS